MTTKDQTWGVLEDVLAEVVYTRDVPPKGGRFWLQRDDASNWAVLHVYTYNVNTYHPEEMRRTDHEFLVPVATYRKSAWMRWVFDCILAIETHETCESFQIRDDTGCGDECFCVVCGHHRQRHDGRTSSCIIGCESHRFSCKVAHTYRPYAPHHGKGENPYQFWPGGTAEQKRKSPGDD